MPVINDALHNDTVNKVASFVHLYRHALVYRRIGGPQGSGERGQASLAWYSDSAVASPHIFERVGVPGICPG
jgi:hypothetical protein